MEIFKIRNDNGISAVVSSYGGRIMRLFTPDREGIFSDIVLGYDDIEDYMNSNEVYFGAAIGRYGNRVGNARFSIDGREYVLAKNNGMNNLHGGIMGFHKVFWDVTQIDSSTLDLTYFSHDMEEGFPGNLNVRMVYQITKNNELKIEYFADTDKKTIVNLTHHSFFNLSGNFENTINHHLLQLAADYITAVNEEMIPTGELMHVKGTPFDFRKLRVIGSRLDEDHEQLKYGLGYDHNWVLKNEIIEGNIRFAGMVKEPESGRIVEVYTNEPGIQFYGGNFLNGSDIGKNNTVYHYRTAFCLETQHFPDSPNKAEFPSTLLEPGEEYYSVCIYKFLS